MHMPLALALTKELDTYTPCITKRGNKDQGKINRRLLFLVEKIIRIGIQFFSKPQQEKLIAVLSYAAKKHAGVYRKDGKTPYLIHPLEVATILIDLGIYDFKIIIAAILHDVPEDTGTPLKEIGVLFGSGVKNIVSLVTIPPDQMEKTQFLSFVKIGTDEQFWDYDQAIVERIKRPFDAIKKKEYWLAMKREPDLNCRWRVIALKFADRKHNIKTLGVMSPEKRKHKLQETKDEFPELYVILQKTMRKLHEKRTFKDKKMLEIPSRLRNGLLYEMNKHT